MIRVGHDKRWGCRATGECRGDGLLADHGLWHLGELLRLRESDLHADAAEGKRHQGDCTDRRDNCRSTRNPFSERTPESALARRDIAHARDDGPEQPTTEPDQQGRKRREGKDHRDHHADGTRQPQRPVALELSGEQHKQAQCDRAAARDDGGRCTTERGCHRSATVVDQSQFIPVSSDQQQRVVGASTEDQDRQDALDRRIRLQADHREHTVSGDASNGIRESNDRQRHEPQDRAAVGDNQQHGNNKHGHEQQREVCTSEDTSDVDSEPLWPGEECGQPVREAFSSSVAHRLGTVGLLGRLGEFGERHGHDGG